jgi:hypothetical protein
MAAIIMMPHAIDLAYKQICTNAAAQAVNALAAKYGFDAEEASRFLKLDELKVVRKRGPSPKTEDKKAAEKAEKDEKKAVKKAEKLAEKAAKNAEKPEKKPKKKPVVEAVSEPEAEVAESEPEAEVAESEPEAEVEVAEVEAEVDAESEPEPVAEVEVAEVEVAEVEVAEVAELEPKKTNRTKKAPAGLIPYGKSVRAEVKSKLTLALVGDDKLTIKATNAVINAQWCELDDAIKDHWNELALGA